MAKAERPSKQREAREADNKAERVPAPPISRNRRNVFLLVNAAVLVLWVLALRIYIQDDGPVWAIPIFGVLIAWQVIKLVILGRAKVE